MLSLSTLYNYSQIIILSQQGYIINHDDSTQIPVVCPDRLAEECFHELTLPNGSYYFITNNLKRVVEFTMNNNKMSITFRSDYDIIFKEYKY